MEEDHRHERPCDPRLFRVDLDIVWEIVEKLGEGGSAPTRSRRSKQEGLSSFSRRSSDATIAEYDVAPCEHFVMLQDAESWPTQILVVQNWFEELKVRVPLRKPQAATPSGRSSMRLSARFEKKDDPFPHGALDNFLTPNRGGSRSSCRARPGTCYCPLRARE
jgi:hypothetical protein